KQSEFSCFSNSLFDELSTVCMCLVMHNLNVRIKKLFGFDFSDLLEEIGDAGKSNGRKPATRKLGKKKKAKSGSKDKRK
ncbi:MAG: hypothetical protein AABM67_15605, partial [Acidobacteriota bacterium]